MCEHSNMLSLSLLPVEANLFCVDGSKLLENPFFICPNREDAKQWNARDDKIFSTKFIVLGGAD